MLVIIELELDEGVVIGLELLTTTEELLLLDGVDVRLWVVLLGGGALCVDVVLVVDFEEPRARYAPAPITTMITTTTTTITTAAMP